MEKFSELSKSLAASVRVESFGNVYIGGRKIQAGYAGVEVVHLLSRIVRSRNLNDRFWLIRRRTSIRRVISLDRNELGSLGVRKILMRVIEETKCDHVRRLAIWMRGLLGGNYGGTTMAEFSSHEDWRMRKEVARALKRLSVWHELREMEEEDTNSRVRRMAKQRSPKSFSKRWSQSSFSKNGEKTMSVKRPLFVDESVEMKANYFPKSIGVIRYYLKQIRNTLSGC